MRREVIGGCELTCEDCMELMARYPDKHFDLAIVDPPYGNNDAIGIKNGNKHSALRKDYKIFYNEPPTDLYFIELKRVSIHQIIFGSNYFGLRGGAICWWKHGTAFGECELAYCSQINSVRLFDFVWNGMLQENMSNKEQRIHPTQKPVALYKWLLSKYAKPDWKILDTHLGSGSHAIACYDMGFPLTACEIDEDYFTAAVERLRLFAAQGTLDFGGENEKKN